MLLRDAQIAVLFGLIVHAGIYSRLIIWLCAFSYSVHLETQFFLALVSPVEGTETGLIGGGEEKDKIQNGGLK